jgi:diguanylate cyclase (GGDEF)-like protein/PAS domain S-box-containing protein
MEGARDGGRWTDPSSMEVLLATERRVQRFRVACLAFGVLVALVEPGDFVPVSALLIAVLAGSTIGVALVLRAGPSRRALRRTGALAMGADSLTVLLVLANNISDPFEAKYAVVVLPVLEAALRWGLRGAISASAAGALAVVAWTGVVAGRTGTELTRGQIGTRGGVVFLVGLGMGAVVSDLRRERRSAEMILDSSRDVIATIDFNGTVRTVSASAESVLGYRPEELQGRSYTDVLYDGATLEDGRLLAQLRRGASTRMAIRRCRRADGSAVWLELGVTSDVAAGVAYIIGRDVSDRLAQERALAEREQRYRSLFAHHPDAIYSFDLDGNYVEVNGGCEVLTGYSEQEMLELSFAQLVVAEDLEHVGRRFAAAVAGAVQRYECSITTKDGSVRLLDVTNSPVLVDGSIAGVYGIAKDVTDQREAERKLTLSRERYKSLFDRNPDAVYAVDTVGRFLSGNLSCTALSGYQPEELMDRQFADLIDPQDLPRVVGHFTATLEGQSQDYECGLIRKDGSRVDLRVTNLPVVLDGDVVGVYGIAKDVTDRKVLERQLRRQARHDALTQLPNRAELLERLSAALDAAPPVWTLFIDLDRFKLVNDSLGHAVGDSLLQAAVGRISSGLRGDDLLTRFAGDEFCAVLAPGTTHDGAQAVASRILEALGRPFSIEGHELHVSASIGIASGVKGEEPDAVVRRADIAMYEAKAAGRSRAVAYQAGGSERARSELSLQNQLRHAIERDELEVHFQPVVSTGSETVGGAEALLRWNHPEHGVLTPDRFIATVQSAGIADAIDVWVLSKSLDAAATWPDEICVAVNVFPSTLRCSRFVETVLANLERVGVAPQRLTLEITEGALLDQPEVTRGVIAELRAAGVRIALDDFGTGYSSLAYLERYAVDVLKIDRLFVERLGNRERDAVVEAVLAIGDALGLQTVAEGVETDAQRRRLADLGCGWFQGWLVAPALSGEAFAELVAPPVPAA